MLNRIRSLPNTSGGSALTVIMTGPGWKGDKSLGPCQIENQNIMTDETTFKLDGLDLDIIASNRPGNKARDIKATVTQYSPHTSTHVARVYLQPQYYV